MVYTITGYGQISWQPIYNNYKPVALLVLIYQDTKTTKKRCCLVLELNCLSSICSTSTLFITLECKLVEG
jgi:hypothetical protein